MRRILWLAPAALLACSGETADPALGPEYDDPVWEQTDDAKADTSSSGYVRQIDWDGFVLVPAGADDGTVQWHVRRQVKSALGALLHSPKISLRDRDARSNLDTRSFVRDQVRVVGSDGKDLGALDRVRYHYRDRALVPKTYKSTSFSFTALFGDYIARAGELRPKCSDDQTVDADSLWFHYDPGMSACRAAIAAETTAINAAAAKLPAGQAVLAQVDSDRRFLTLRAKLTTIASTATRYPEYDRLYGFGTDRQMVVVYSFFGVDADDANPRDNGLVEALRYVRTMRAAFPGFRVVYTSPSANLLDFWVDGKLLSNVTYEDVASWVIDGRGWPGAVGGDSGKQRALLEQARDRWRERWIFWQLPVEATRNGETRRMTVELRTYYGREDGRDDWRQAARNRYLEAFWHADVFSYTGHSHFGHGPLEPVAYNGGNFPNRYQVMLFNSCVSYNYYDVDFLEMHPGGAANLDLVSNGLPAYWPAMGESSAKYVLNLIDGQNRSWAQSLDYMRVTVAGLPSSYEPMRAVTGEEGNAFDPAKGKITVTAR